MFAQRTGNWRTSWLRRPITPEAFPPTVSKNKRTSRSTSNEIQKKETRLLQQRGEKNNQKELNLSPQRAVQLFIPPGGLGQPSHRPHPANFICRP
jgi:hypothetical protein